MKASLVPWCAIAAFAATLGCKPGGKAPSNVQTQTLSNGLRVVSVYFPGSTNVALFTFLPMGLANDGPGQAQWSHLVEHLVIRSTVPTDLSMANAETLPDHMRLDFYGHAGDWTEGLSHHRRWLEGLLFTEASLSAEKPKVVSECDVTARNFATHKFALAAWAQGFRHGQTRAALKGDVYRASLGEIQQYRDRRLAPLSNVVVCVVGGVEPARALAPCSQAFGALSSSAAPATAVKPQPGMREMTWDLDARHLVITWPIPTCAAAEFPALLAAAQWLNMQFFSDPTIQKMAGLAFAGADLATPEGNYFYLSASLRPGSTFQDVQARLDHHLQRLVSSGEDLAALPQLGRQLAEGLTSVPDPRSMKAQLPAGVTPAMVEMNVGLQWGMSEYRYGLHKAALARGLAGLKTDEVRQAAKHHLAASARSVIALRPAGP